MRGSGDFGYREPNVNVLSAQYRPFRDPWRSKSEDVDENDEEV
jgi:hypothetical protein